MKPAGLMNDGDSTGIPLSTYFSAIKLRWMLDHDSEVREAHEKDDLMLGTIDSWLVYVSSYLPFVPFQLTQCPPL